MTDGNNVRRGWLAKSSDKNVDEPVSSWTILKRLLVDTGGSLHFTRSKYSGIREETAAAILAMRSCLYEGSWEGITKEPFANTEDNLAEFLRKWTWGDQYLSDLDRGQQPIQKASPMDAFLSYSIQTIFPTYKWLLEKYSISWWCKANTVTSNSLAVEKW